MRVQRGGAGTPTLLLLHGLGATGDVWLALGGLLDSRWPGRWIAPDLLGHGGSPASLPYSFASFATAVASTVDGPGEVYVLGHSLGGAVGAELASSSYGVRVAGVLALGVKVSWTEDELAQARAFSERPVTWYESRDDAVERHLRVAGLADLVPPDSPLGGVAVVGQGGRWRLTLDPRTFAVGAPDMARLISLAQSPVRLARGEHDHMVSDEQLRALDAEAITLPGVGHNAHVEDPATVVDLIGQVFRS